MDFSKKMMASIKAEDLAGLQAELIGCLDEDVKSQEPPKTLALAEAIAKVLAEKSPPLELFEKDNGNFDFASVPMNKDGLREVKARLRINFSKETIAYACKIIASLNATSDSTTTPISEKRPIDTPAVLQPETKPAPEVLVQESSIRSSKPEPSKGSAVEKDVGTSVKTAEEHKEKTDQPSAKISERSSAPEPEMPSVPEPEMPSAPEPEMPSVPEPEMPSAPEPEKSSSGKDRLAESTKSASSAVGQASSLPQSPRPKGRVPGFWERAFGAVGRCIDEFLKRLCGR